MGLIAGPWGSSKRLLETLLELDRVVKAQPFAEDAFRSA